MSSVFTARRLRPDVELPFVVHTYGGHHPERTIRKNLLYAKTWVNRRLRPRKLMFLQKESRGQVWVAEQRRSAPRRFTIMSPKRPIAWPLPPLPPGFRYRNKRGELAQLLRMNRSIKWN
jgi:hypothetical protein